MANRSNFIPKFTEKTQLEAVNKNDFNLPVYFGDALATKPEELNKQKKIRRFPFKDADIAKIPLLTEPPPNSQVFIDLTDDVESIQNAYLLLRITHKEKAFYIKTKRSKNTVAACRKIAIWQPRDRGGKGSRPPSGYMTTVDARKEFQKLYDQLSTQTTESRQIGSMTIKEYITYQYAKDRENYNLKSGKRKKLKPETIKQITQGFPLWIDRKLKDVEKGWVEEFIAYWDSLIVTDPETKRPILDPKTGNALSTNSSETRRKKYTIINAMFNMCAQRGYIHSNPIEGEIGRFPRSKFKSKVEYKYEYDVIIKHLFQSEDVNGSLAGKIIIASMILCGARNSEIFRNYTSSFNLEARTLFIPEHISKNGAERTLLIENDTYWEFIELYLTHTHFKNAYGHMFPSTKKEGHVTEAVYRPVWKTLKSVINQDGRLYDVRHTFARRVEREFGISKAAEILGDSIETAHNHYVKGNDDEKFEVMKAVQSKASNNTPKLNTTPHNADVLSEQKIVIANEEFMPSEVVRLLNMFKNGKIFPASGQMYEEQWRHFVSLISNNHQRSNMGEDVDDWLMMQ
ncbi:tyrosine-type recombinase/integrase [Agarivorans sp. TSD2052]|uniref:tyrosine-type recombinase/integrase n=1 Tax=Agarivorans sp. TSD2052 TaxID=2937286 RepID=UPI00200F1EA4|nr:tyrosine-type recombinase/integrase [Agarivorans sp. TSD2052]UPW20129.1 tyrosine-type recombinase/integrase [Agarivorans sp. TSD2052]